MTLAAERDIKRSDFSRHFLYSLETPVFEGDNHTSQAIDQTGKCKRYHQNRQLHVDGHFFVHCNVPVIRGTGACDTRKVFQKDRQGKCVTTMALMYTCAVSLQWFFIISLY